MIAAEVLQICRLVKACCPSQQFDQYTPDAWGLILGGWDFEDAKAAIAAIVSAPLEPGKSRYIEPGHVIGGVMRIRAKRLDAQLVPAPPAELESAAEQIAWQRRVREQIARGTYRPPTDPPQVGSPARRDMALTAATPTMEAR